MNVSYLHLIIEYEVTEYRGGCVYKTRMIGPKWVPMEDGEKAPKGFFYSSPNEAEIKKWGDGGWNTIRRVVS